MKKKYSLIFIIGFFLVLFFLKKKISAEWRLDLNPPKISSVLIRCAPGTINQTQIVECKEENFILKLICSDDVDIGSGCDNAYYFIRHQSNNLENNCVLRDYPPSPQGKYSGQSNQFIFETTIENNQNFYRICVGSSDLAGNFSMIEKPFYVVNPSAFFKLRDASLSKKGSVTLTPPLTVLPFDDQDTNERYLIIGEAGVVGANGSININFPPNHDFLLSNKRLQISPYSQNIIFGRKFMDYAKSRKMTHDINSIAEIKKEMINIITTDELVIEENLSNVAPTVLIVRKRTGEGFGKIVFRSQSGSKETNQENIFFYAGEIEFSKEITSAKGIFFANKVTFNSKTEGFKITGNLISDLEVEIEERKDDYRKPSFFLVFDAKQYLNLLPLISFSKYDWFKIN